MLSWNATIVNSHFVLKWDSIIADDIVMLQEEDEENDVRDAIQKSLQKNMPW